MAETLELFESEPPSDSETSFDSGSYRPLADLLRPKELTEYRGISQLDKRLIGLIESGHGTPPSIIIWGPPGCGKTTLARIIGKSFQSKFVEVSAVLVGVKEIRQIAEAANQYQGLTLLFVDEIHRLNKAQQDAFLPHVERGTFVLIGATTENPSFYLNSALLSRTRVLPLAPLDFAALHEIVLKASKKLNLLFSEPAIALLCECCGGDARQLLNLIENFHQSAELESVSGEVSEDDLRAFLKDSKQLFYDRSGEEHYNMISAFIKSMRGSDPDAALFWCFRMIESGEDPRFLIRRMIIFASEDIGNADSRALQLAVATAEAYDRLGLPEGKIPIAHCVTYLASTAKSNRSYVAMHKAIDASNKHPKVTVPMHIRNAPTGLMKGLGYGEGYKYPHDHSAEDLVGVEYLPEEVKGAKFYTPSESGQEAAIRQRLGRKNDS